jgi:hypothetical protein
VRRQATIDGDVVTSLPGARGYSGVMLLIRSLQTRETSPSKSPAIPKGAGSMSQDTESRVEITQEDFPMIMEVLASTPALESTVSVVKRIESAASYPITDPAVLQRAFLGGTTSFGTGLITFDLETDFFSRLSRPIETRGELISRLMTAFAQAGRTGPLRARQWTKVLWGWGYYAVRYGISLDVAGGQYRCYASPSPFPISSDFLPNEVTHRMIGYGDVWLWSPNAGSYYRFSSFSSTDKSSNPGGGKGIRVAMLSGRHNRGARGSLSRAKDANTHS